MAFKNFIQSKIDYNNKLLDWIKGNSSSSFNHTFDVKFDGQLLQNSYTADQVIEVSNAFFDQLAAKRSQSRLNYLPFNYLETLKTQIENDNINLKKKKKKYDDKVQSINETKTESLAQKEISKTLSEKITILLEKHARS